MDLASLRERLAGPTLPPEAVAARPGTPSADDLIPGTPVSAAVLVPLVHGPAPGVLLTLRTSHLRTHAGQVSFPGGRADPTDTSAEDTALREAEEEIGLRRADVELAGRLPVQLTGTGYRVTPVVALLPPGLPLAPSPDEVAAIFTLPLSTLLDPAAPQRHTGEFRGQQRRFWVWPHEQHYIWGATAAILVQLAERLRARVENAA